MAEKGEKHEDNTKLDKSAGAAVGLLVFGGLFLAFGHGHSGHSAAPNADHSGAQPSYSGPAAPGRTHETTKPKAVASSAQKPVVPVKGPDILSWPQVPETFSNDTIDLTKAPGGHETLIFDPHATVKSLLISVRGAHGASMTFNVTLDANRNHDNIISFDGKTETLGQASETLSPDGSLEVITSGDAPGDLNAIGLTEVTH